jgi:hypothetical protein
MTDLVQPGALETDFIHHGDLLLFGALETVQVQPGAL